MVNPIKDFGATATSLAKTPLGIIALFIVLIYAMASLVVGLTGHLASYERIPLVVFLVVFPNLVLVVFAWLVAKYHTNLYSPGEYQDQRIFYELASRQAQAAIYVNAAEVKTEIAPLLEEAINIADSVAEVQTSERILSLLGSALSRISSPEAVRIEDSAQAHSRIFNRQSDSSIRDYTDLTSSRGPEVLWVDDLPDNNIFERRALEALGINVAIALSTDEAMSRLQSTSFDAIISDMGRPEGPQAGYELLGRVRKQFAHIPFFIYAGSRLPEHVEETKRRGGNGTTNRPNELVAMVTHAVKR